MPQPEGAGGFRFPISLARGVQWLAAAAVFVFLAWIGMRLAKTSDQGILVWPVAGFAVALLLRFGSRMLPGIALGAILAAAVTAHQPSRELAPGMTVVASLMFAAGMIMQPVAIAAATRWWAGGMRFLDRPRGVFLFALFACVGGVIAPLSSAAFTMLAGGQPLAGVLFFFLGQWLGDSMGVLIATPSFLVAMLPSRKVHPARGAPREMVAFLVVLVALSYWLSTKEVPPTSYLEHSELSFLAFPLVVWGAFRFGVPGVALATIFLWVASIVGAFQTAAASREPSLQVTLILAQGFSAVITVTGLSLAAALADREKTRAQLRSAHSRMEHRVEDRTAELHRANLMLERELAERLHAEAALRESEHRYRMIVENRTDLIVRWRPDGRLTFVNEPYCRLMAIPPEAELSRNMLDHLTAEERLSFLRRVDEVTPEDPDFITEQQLRTADDRYRWLQWNHQAIFNAAGELVEFQSVGWDVTHRRVAEDALRRTNQLNRRILETVPGGVMLLSTRGEVLLSSRYASEMLGLQELPGARLERLFCGLLSEDGDPISLMEHPAMRCLSSGEEQPPRTLGLTRKDGEPCWAVFSAAPFFDPITRRQDGAVVAFVDITERKRAEAERERIEKQMLAAQKLESLGVLAGGIAHDFNNLLVSILGNAGLALLEMGPDSPARPTVETIETAAMRASELTRQLLAYSGRGRFVVEPVCINRTVDEMMQILRVSISKKAQLIFERGAGLPAVEADASQIRQVVMNLITNASEAIGAGSGVIRLRTSVRNPTGKELSALVGAQSLSAGLYVCLEVEDTGCGMNRETLQRMFEPFFSTKFTGRGLGMAAVLGIVRGHGGAIGVDSVVGQGTTVTVFLPASKKNAKPGLMTHPLGGREQQRGLVLFADDEEAVREVAGRILERAGFGYLAARDGIEALELYDRYRDAVDVIIVDLTMPRLSGHETLAALRQRDCAAAILFTSGYSEYEMPMAGGETVVADGFIQKPYQQDALVAAVGEAIRRRRPRPLASEAAV